jgi:hypothetical protein
LCSEKNAHGGNRNVISVLRAESQSAPAQKMTLQRPDNSRFAFVRWRGYGKARRTDRLPSARRLIPGVRRLIAIGVADPSEALKDTAAET